MLITATFSPICHILFVKFLRWNAQKMTFEENKVFSKPTDLFKFLKIGFCCVVIFRNFFLPLIFFTSSSNLLLLQNACHRWSLLLHKRKLFEQVWVLAHDCLDFGLRTAAYERFHQRRLDPNEHRRDLHHATVQVVTSLNPLGDPIFFHMETVWVGYLNDLVLRLDMDSRRWILEEVKEFARRCLTHQWISLDLDLHGDLLGLQDFMAIYFGEILTRGLGPLCGRNFLLTPVSIKLLQRIIGLVTVKSLEIVRGRKTHLLIDDEHPVFGRRVHLLFQIIKFSLCCIVRLLLNFNLIFGVLILFTLLFFFPNNVLLRLCSLFTIYRCGWSWSRSRYEFAHILTLLFRLYWLRTISTFLIYGQTGALMITCLILCVLFVNLSSSLITWSYQLEYFLLLIGSCLIELLVLSIW